MTTHCRFSASSAHRWMACPGSIRLIEALPPAKRDTESEYAKEGTLAHSLAYQWLRDGKAPKFPDEEMREAVRLYVKYVIEDTGTAPTAMHLETKVMAAEDCGGTADCVLLRDGVLEVVDFKYGKGVQVDPTWNPQLLIYAHGASKLLKEYTRVLLTIVQPRVCDTPVSFEVEKASLAYWWGATLMPALDAAKAPDAPLHAGEHCRFCPAMGSCSAQAEKALEVARAGFDIKPPAPNALTVEQVAKVLGFADLMREWLGAVEAHAHDLLSSGAEVPGYKLVQKKANRVWREDDKIEELLRKVLGGDCYTKRLVSPAQAEKLLKPLGADGLVKEWSLKPDTGLTVAPMDDPRPPVDAAKKAFEAELEKGEDRG